VDGLLARHFYLVLAGIPVEVIEPGLQTGASGTRTPHSFADAKRA